MTRVALVTGGSEGLGAACVRALRQAGWNVAILSLPGAALDAVAPEDGLLVVGGDVTSDEARRRAITATLAKWGRLDCLVNNAAVGLYAPPSTVDIELSRRLLDVNVLAPVAMAQLVIPLMRGKGGTIVNIGSVGGLVSLPWAVMYCASKFALHAIDDSLHRELTGTGIHVVKVCPGIIATKFRDHVLAGVAPADVSAIQRVVSPDQVATAIVRAIEKRRRTVYVPTIGRLFTAMGILTPWLMDWYIARKWEPRADIG